MWFLFLKTLSLSMTVFKILLFMTIGQNGNKCIVCKRDVWKLSHINFMKKQSSLTIKCIWSNKSFAIAIGRPCFFDAFEYSIRCTSIHLPTYVSIFIFNFFFSFCIIPVPFELRILTYSHPLDAFGSIQFKSSSRHHRICQKYIFGCQTVVINDITAVLTTIKLN